MVQIKIIFDVVHFPQLYLLFYLYAHSGCQLQLTRKDAIGYADANLDIFLFAIHLLWKLRNIEAYDMKEDAAVSAMWKRIIILEIGKVINRYFFVEIEWITNRVVQIHQAKAHVATIAKQICWLAFLVKNTQAMLTSEWVFLFVRRWWVHLAVAHVLVFEILGFKYPVAESKIFED